MDRLRVDRQIVDRLLPLLWAGFLTLLIASPWLAPGYLFGTDWPGPRRFDFPTEASSSVPLRFALALLSRATSGELTGKTLVLSLLFIAALLAYRVLPKGGFMARASASSIYLINPFVYGRLHYGQLFLLAGYAVLPLVAVELHRLLQTPGWTKAVRAAIGLWLLGTLSLHLIVVTAVLASALLIPHVVARRADLAYLRRLVLGIALTAGIALATSAYWVIPLLTGRGSEGSTLARIGTADLAVYAAVPDAQLGLMPNLLGLYGFWAEVTGRFTSMKYFVPFWPAILALLLLSALFGAMSAFRQDRDRLAAWVAGLLLATVVGTALEMGQSQSVSFGLVKSFDAHVPLYLGMRDAGKWAALLALVYSQLFGLSAVAIVEAIRERLRGTRILTCAEGVAAAVLLALPLYYGNGLLFGAHGEIRPSPYPQGWYAADRELLADSTSGRVLFLPWHGYMRFSFVGNQNQVISSPAPTFFSRPVLVSVDPELNGIAPPTGQDQVAVSRLVTSGSQGQWAQVLAARNIKYVLVARELDWRSYDYLGSQAGLVKVGDYGTIVLYRNTLMP